MKLEMTYHPPQEDGDLIVLHFDHIGQIRSGWVDCELEDWIAELFEVILHVAPDADHLGVGPGLVEEHS